MLPKGTTFFIFLYIIHVQLNTHNNVRCKGNATRGTIYNFQLFMAQVNFSCLCRWIIYADAISCILFLKDTN